MSSIMRDVICGLLHKPRAARLLVVVELSPLCDGNDKRGKKDEREGRKGENGGRYSQAWFIYVASLAVFFLSPFEKSNGDFSGVC